MQRDLQQQLQQLEQQQLLQQQLRQQRLQRQPRQQRLQMQPGNKGYKYSNATNATNATNARQDIRLMTRKKHDGGWYKKANFQKLAYMDRKIITISTY